ncbi:hydrogenase subunit MbhD domain-containing protein [Thermococcus paralvinellae]|uniref:MrpA C-terminal/MbhD domain-containing protein n=1 Tax=Thermococcus paralvinellae TaxID=582419 RepID=W0I0H6_9EURY|nr:hydrogenase subunit MbhD domain-containing protein [Thermococcus paralvinellae]AHF79504.1 Hypothetical protein TES1_0107 [Thermococcus paralvinellae]
MIEIHLLILSLALMLGFVASYLAVTEKDLLKAVGFSAVQAISYAIVFYILMAPDIILAYIAIAVGIYSALLIFAISKTGRYEVV